MVSIEIPTYNNSDNLISITVNNENIEFTNKSNDFMNIIDVSSYVGDDVQTFHNLNSIIPPRSSITMANTIFLSQHKNLEPHKMTLNDIKNFNKSYGFAISYSTHSNKENHSIYKLNNNLILRY